MVCTIPLVRVSVRCNYRDFIDQKSRRSFTCTRQGYGSRKRNNAAGDLPHLEQKHLISLPRFSQKFRPFFGIAVEVVKQDDVFSAIAEPDRP